MRVSVCRLQCPTEVRLVGCWAGGNLALDLCFLWRVLLDRRCITHWCGVDGLRFFHRLPFLPLHQGVLFNFNFLGVRRSPWVYGNSPKKEGDFLRPTSAKWSARVFPRMSMCEGVWSHFTSSPKASVVPARF